MLDATRELRHSYLFVTDLQRAYLYDVWTEDLLLHADSPIEFLHTFDDVLAKALVLDGSLLELRRPPRTGVARQLVAQLKDRASALGSARIDLEVRQGNEAAIRLYENAGFAAVGRRKGYYQDSGEDAILMTWTRGTVA